MSVCRYCGRDALVCAKYGANVCDRAHRALRDFIVGLGLAIRAFVVAARAAQSESKPKSALDDLPPMGSGPELTERVRRMRGKSGC